MRSSLSLIDRFLSLIEGRRPSDKIILRVLFFLVIASGLIYAIAINNKYLITIPTKGGVLTEGIVGVPRFVNPALAIARADQDVVTLLYSGLMKISPEGELEPDIAELVTVSEDGTSYSILIKRDRTFHDGTPITARDVAFTINLIRDPDLKSPLRGNWNDVTVEERGEYEIVITLPEPYAPFIENFTFGIMPHHIWSNVPIEQLPFSQYNTEPIGSGPFMITKVSRDTSGLISGYTLKPAKETKPAPNLDAIELLFFQNEEQLAKALNAGDVDSTVFLPEEILSSVATDTYQILHQPLPRVFGIFFNQNRSASLRDKAAREALNAALDKQKIVDEVLNGFGVPMDGPIVTSHGAVILNDTDETDQATTTRTAESILTNGGWKKNESGFWEKRIDQVTERLSITIRTGNSELFTSTAALVIDSWRELGVEVSIEQYEQTGLVQSVIRSRDFEALLFGIDMNRLQDLYPFWHSSQKDDPGLNVAQYTNVNVDQLLATARTTQDKNERLKLLNEAAAIIESEFPAIFLFAPNINYVVAKNISVTPMSMLGRPADRFMNISKWHAEANDVWPIFDKN